VALRANQDALLDVLEAQDSLERVIKRLLDAEEAVMREGATPAKPPLRRPMNAAVQVMRGVALWDRDPADEPASLRAVQ